MSDIKIYNTRIQQKGRELRASFKNRVIQLQETAGGSDQKLRNNIRVKFRRTYGEIDRIRFAFPRHGYFFLKGVGAGYKSAGNGVVRIAKTDSGKHRQPKDWAQPIESYEEEIANIAMEHFGNRAIDVKHLKSKFHVK